MLTFKTPSEAEVIAYLIKQRGMAYSYSEVGATLDRLPAGYDVDRHRVRLGYGEETFERAKNAVRRWKMFPVEMSRLYWPDKPIEQGTIVAVLFRAGCFWALNPARIVYTIDDCVETANGRVHRFGFAYGTLPDHLECGEERFTVEWHEADYSVWYELLAFSKPQHILSRIGYPLARREQARFRVLSGQSMQAAAKSESCRIVEPCVA